VPGFDYSQFWNYSLACAVAARRLASQTRHVIADDAYAVGLLAGIGNWPSRQRRRRSNADVLEAVSTIRWKPGVLERKRLATTYRETGANLIAEWGLPAHLAKVVRYQQEPDNPNLGVKGRSLAQVLARAVLLPT